MSADRLTAIWGAQVIACPKCDAQLLFFRSRTPRIDSCGFESYRLECKQCAAALAGIIDPSDETLLLSALEKIEAETQHSRVSPQRAASRLQRT
jgi:hypothetical protein